MNSRYVWENDLINSISCGSLIQFNFTYDLNWNDQDQIFGVSLFHQPWDNNTAFECIIEPVETVGAALEHPGRMTSAERQVMSVST